VTQQVIDFIGTAEWGRTTDLLIHSQKCAFFIVTHGAVNLQENVDFTDTSTYTMLRGSPPLPDRFKRQKVPKLKLTDLTLQALKPSPITYWDTSLPAFGVRCGKHRKTFTVMHGTDRKRQTIGHYPEMSLAAARKAAMRVLGTANPKRQASIDFKEALQLFVENHLQKRNRPKTAKETERLLTKHFLPHLSAKDIPSITTQQLDRNLDRLSPPSIANHAFVAARTFFRWCVARRYIPHSPLEGVRAPAKSTDRSRVLSDAELKAVWKVADQIGGNYGMIVKLLLCSGQRRGEIAALQSSWIQNDHIVLPKEITKNRKEHTFPIGAMAISLLSEHLWNDGYIFAARGSNGATPFNGWSKSKALLDALSGVKDWTLHDCRRTMSTRMAEMGVAPHVIERLLNHVTGTLSPIALVYNKAKYLEEMREAINRWEAHLAEVVKS
jgi:integrase